MLRIKKDRKVYSVKCSPPPYYSDGVNTNFTLLFNTKPCQHDKVKTFKKFNKHLHKLYFLLILWIEFIAISAGIIWVGKTGRLNLPAELAKGNAMAESSAGKTKPLSQNTGHRLPILYGTASWYSVESCKREGTWQKYGGKTASGKKFDDSHLVCAAWGFPFGTRLKVVNIATQKEVVVVVEDRGPAKYLYKRGRIIDLSKEAFRRIADLRQGVIKVRVEVLYAGRKKK